MANTTDIELTESERIAKEMFMKLFLKGHYVPCDAEYYAEQELPTWYDEIKYKRGQDYFQNNRAGIFNSNLIGLICLLSEPRGLKILAMTGKSSTKETARKRYFSTILHTLSWYDVDLSPGSRSRKSLSTVRKLHFTASKSAQNKGIGPILQIELAITAFGFMGIALIRPHLLSIYHDNDEDREAFVHLWAVLLHMIGIEERFNICLLPLDALEVLCQMFMRYKFLPNIQIETPLFKEMTTALLEGLNTIIPHLDYESKMFAVRSLCSVPGYQHDVDLDKEILCRSILTQADIDSCNAVMLEVTGPGHLPMFTKIPVVEIYETNDNSQFTSNCLDVSDEHSDNINLETIEEILHKELQLTKTEILKINLIDYDTEWKAFLNDNKFKGLNLKSQKSLNFNIWLRDLLKNYITRFLVECFLSYMLNQMRKTLEKI